MESSERSRNADSELSKEGICGTQPYALIRGALACVVFAALAACQDSTSSTLANSTETASVTPAVSIVAVKRSVAAGTATTLQWSAQGVQSCAASGGWTGTQPTSGRVTTDPLMATTSYTLTCTGPAGSASQSAEVVVTSAAPEVTLTATPSTVSMGGSSTLEWTSKNAAACAASGGWSGGLATSGSWSTGALSNTTEYELVCIGAGGSATQAVTVTVAPLAPQITLMADPSTVNAGAGTLLSWSTTNASACSAEGAWSGSRALNGSLATGPLSADAAYTLICTGPGGKASQTMSISVKPPAPIVEFAATPSTIASGTSSTLKWSSANASSCTASGAWSGSKSVGGSQSTGVLSANTVYTLTCSNSGGSASQSATVSIKAPAPAVRLSVGPSAVATGGSATLTWSATNAVTCIASGDWSGPKAINGSQSTGALTANETYTLSCTGQGGTAAQSATVSVKAPTPTISFAPSPSSVVSGGSATLAWSAANATSCTASGAWSGSKPVSGSQSTGALSATATYSLSCSGAGGSATQSTTVSVSKTPTASVALSANPSSIVSGASSTLTWSSDNATSCTASGAWSGSKALSGSQSTGVLKANSTFVLTCAGAGGSAAQSATVSVSAAAPTVSLTAEPSTVKSGAASTLVWSSTNASSCAASGAWSGGKALSGSYSTGALQSNQTYTITCTGSSGATATQSATISVSAPAPTVTMSATPSTVASGGKSTLNWSSTNATSCTASGAWSGSTGLRGSTTTGPIDASSTYILSCTGSGGTASQSATVSVSSAAPIVKFTASPSTVASGASSTLTWSSSNATACTGSGAWSGSKATSGSQSTGALKAGATYRLTCTGSGGTATQSATVSVTAAAPSVTFTANPATVKSGATSMLTWTSTDDSSCTASGGWSGSQPTSGSKATASMTATTRFILTCTGAGGSATQSATITVAATAPSISLSASPSRVASGGKSTLAWSSSNATSCTAASGWSGTLATSGTRVTGAISAATTYTVSCTGAGGTATQSVTVGVASQAGGQVARPSYNTGNGFFVAGGKLYDANGVEFRIRGVDRAHYDSPSQPGISNSGANAVRMFLFTLGGGMASKYANVLQTQHIDYGEAPIPVMSIFPDGTTVSCNSSTSELASGVAWWVANASTFTPLNRYMMINIANEWGPSNSATWASAYESAIASLRAAGYLGTLVIDAGGCGQDIADLLNYSTAVFNSDPQKNILFSLHIYGNIPTADVASDLAKLASLSQTAGMAFVVGEFGPGRDIGPSPTQTTPGQIITAAEANGIGWMAWAWDDNNLGGGASNNSWFSMTLQGPGYYSKPSDLTEFGQDVVLNSTYGLSVLATPATIF